MCLLKTVSRCLIAIYWLILCGNAVEAQVFPPRYAFIEVTDESGSRVSGAAVVIYNASGEEVRHYFSDGGGVVHVDPADRDVLIDEQKLRDSALCVVRIIKTGYLTYEDSIEGRLVDKFVLEERVDGEWGRARIKVTLLRRPKT